MKARSKETGKFAKPIAPSAPPKASKKLVEKILLRTATATNEEIFGNIGKIVSETQAKKQK